MDQHKLHDREDGLAHCMVCGGAESSLPTKCPGRRMTAQEEDMVSDGKWDFVGHWIAKSSQFTKPSAVRVTP
jgi:hypothetical protein